MVVKTKIPSLYNKYLKMLGHPHNLGSPINRFDFLLREIIGKTDDINESLCSHRAIINREFPEHFCRICNRDLSKPVGRYNDYLVLRHPQCKKPICLDCAKNKPDEFHLAFKRGLKSIDYQRKEDAKLAKVISELYIMLKLLQLQEFKNKEAM